MSIPELSRIDRTIEIKAPADRVWRALTSAAELSAWFQVTIDGAMTADAEVWMTSTHAEHTGQRFRVRIVEMIPPSRTRVTFTLEPSARGTRVSLSETGFDEISLARRAKVYQDNSEGWAEVLVWLQTHVEKAR